MLKLITAPTVVTVTTADAKTWLRVSSSADDSLIDLMVKAATQKIEFLTGRKLLNQTWQLWLDRIPGREEEAWWDGVREGAIGMLTSDDDSIPLELAPVSSISSFKYFEISNTSASTETGTFSSSSYFLDSVSVPSRLCLSYGSVWPPNLRSRNSINIEFVVGYGSAASSVPEALIMAVKALVAHMYEHRGDEGEAVSIPPFVRTMVEPYMVRRVS